MSKRPSTDPQEGLVKKKVKQSFEDASAYAFSTQDSIDEPFSGFQENDINQVLTPL